MKHPQSTDPVFAAIDAHKAAWARYSALIDAQDGDVTMRDDQGADATAWSLARTRPTTLRGCAALVAYVAEFEERGELWPNLGENLEEDHAGDWQKTLNRTLGAALNELAAACQRPAGQAPAWRAADDMTDDLFRVRDYAAVLAGALDGPSDDPIRQGHVRLAYDLVSIGTRLRKHHEKLMNAAARRPG